MEIVSSSIGRISGWFMLAFVAGVGLHSLEPFWHIPNNVWMVIFVLAWPVTFLLLPARWRCIAGVLLSCLIGIWRFDIAPRPTLQRIDGHWLIMNRPAKDEVSTMMSRWRVRLTQRIASALPAPEAALVTGMLYGDQSLSSDQKKLFRSAGLTHLVAVSGSNVTVVVQCVSLIALACHLRRRRAFVVTTIMIVGFVIFVGMAASVVRAALMGWLILIAQIVGRLVDGRRLLLVAATILLLVNPWQLFFDPGFILSFLAMIGLLFWAPVFDELLSPVLPFAIVRSMLSMTLAATLMTAPYLAWIFQRLSLAGLLTNLFVLPLVPFVMAGTAVVGLVGSESVFSFVRVPLYGLAHFIESVAGLAEWMPWSNIAVNHISLSTVAILYISLFYFLFWLRRKKRLSTEKQDF